jgi:predicted ATPase/DNA-binding XRE family transcriptional regulator
MVSGYLQAVERFADMLRRYRARSRLSQAELAEAANLSVRAVSDLERGVRSRPYLPTVRALADALGLDEAESLQFAAAVRRGRISPERFAPPGARTSIPFPFSSFIDREEEMALLNGLITDGAHRLITVTGPPGVGKTRLALEAARRLSAASSLRVTYVNMNDQAQPEHLFRVIAEQFGVVPGQDSELLDLTASSLHEEPCLLILDNLVHLPAAAGQLAELLKMTPFLTVLATSRAPTFMEGEQQLALLPLRVPAEDETSSDPASLTAFPGVALLVARLQEHTPALKLDAPNTRKIAEIARALEGIPLALEIAAGYGPILSLDDLGELVRRPLDLAAPQTRDGPPNRPGTLRNAIDWSYRLLTPGDQAALRRLSLFTGPFTIDDACDFLAGGSHPTFQESVSNGTLARVLHLSQQGLLNRAEDPDTSVFLMLHIIQEYARGELESCGEIAEAQCTLKSMALTFSQAAASHLRDEEEDAWQEIIRRRTSTIVAALRQCGEDRDVETGTDLLWNLGPSFYGGPPGWAVQWVEAALQTPHLSDVHQGKLLVLAALFGMMTGAREPAAETARRGFSLLNEEIHATARREAFDLMRFFIRPPDLIDLSTEADAIVDSIDADEEPVALSRALRARGMRHIIAGEVEAAERDFNLGLSLLPGTASAAQRALLHGLAVVHIRKGDLRAAQRLLHTGLDGPFIGTPVLAVAQMYNLLGIVSEMVGDPDEAGKAYVNALRSAFAAGTTTPLRTALRGVAGLTAGSGRPEEAARMLGAAANPDLSEAASLLVPASRRDELEPALRDSLGDACFEAAFFQGKQLPLERATAEALEELERTT